MKVYKHLLSALSIALLISFSSSQIYAQSQTAMNLKAGSSYQTADKELNVVYQNILKQYAKKQAFIKKLKTAQRLWVQLRDAELAARYPEKGSYGSAGPMCESIYLEKLTRERIKFLQVWLTGIPEGDVCNGSVKVKL